MTSTPLIRQSASRAPFASTISAARVQATADPSTAYRAPASAPRSAATWARCRAVAAAAASAPASPNATTTQPTHSSQIDADP
jgi:hypothetical protein